MSVSEYCFNTDECQGSLKWKNESRFVSNELTQLLKPLLQYPKVITREESKIHSQKEKKRTKTPNYCEQVRW